MKKRFLLFAFLLPFTAFSQFVYLNFDNTVTGPCPYDPSVEVTQPEDWEIYQTIDDKWDSPIDSSLCFSVEDIGGKVRFEFDDVDGNRPIFFRAKFSPEALIPNFLYEATASVDVVFGQPTLNFNTDCNNGLCSGLMMGIEIPDETGTGRTIRWYPFTFLSNQSLFAHACFPTENFADVQLKELIIKMTLDDMTLENNFLEFGSASVAEGDDPVIINEITVTPDYLSGGEYFFPLTELNPNSWEGGYLFQYDAPTYPSNQNLSYVEVELEPNSAEKETINLYAGFLENIHFHPFTEIRGGLLEGDSTERHTVNLINDGGEFCFSFIELIFNDDFNFLHAGGGIDFNTSNSCMMFRNGGSLQILDEAVLDYGMGGTGILAVGSDAEILLGKNSAFHIDNQFMLIDGDDEPEATLDIFLEEGQSFSFGENAQLFRNPFNEDPMFLNVHMLGGTLDDSNLSEEERQLIRRIYPPTFDDFSENVHVFPNPTDGVFKVEINLPQAQNVTVEAMDTNGRLVFRRGKSFPKGISNWVLDEPLAAGVYFLKISSGGETTVSKILVR